MTDEEMAIDYICNEYYKANKKGFTDKEKIILGEEIKENDKKKIKLYLAGLAEGRKETEAHLLDNWCRNEEGYYPYIKQLEKENAELKAQIEQLSNDNHVLKTSFITQQEQIEKMKCLLKEYNIDYKEM